MSEDKALTMGNGLDVRVLTLDCGVKLFRTDPDDVAFIEAVFVDTTGRERTMGVTKSTVLAMVPMEDFGGWPYDPLFSLDPATQAVSEVFDGQGRRVFSQRVVLARSEVFDIVHQVMAQEQSAIAKPSERDIRRLVIP